ncbi:DNA-binding MarR family transcriptional regulator [Nocardiopsis mwathae]|uniref:DNA-binding MarR family transcriptional regulator n=1 Tax=Nocardiopsis mwathae TaxID=1472723 RepID=A0A7W9YI58_9ACTN|nr:transcriptional regulator [Nocardiopsis mwathae]MBB6172410.1 DNA-binding MarR family transcriptional regulator [Nocardiopsis mwathae]
MSHPRKSLDPVIHSPVRFSIVAALAAVDQSDFASVRDTVEVTDSALSKQITTLENSGYIAVRKTFVGRRPRTYLALTPQGRAVFTQHLNALRQIADGKHTG